MALVIQEQILLSDFLGKALKATQTQLCFFFNCSDFASAVISNADVSVFHASNV